MDCAVSKVYPYLIASLDVLQLCYSTGSCWCMGLGHINCFFNARRRDYKTTCNATKWPSHNPKLRHNHPARRSRILPPLRLCWDTSDRWHNEHPSFESPQNSCNGCSATTECKQEISKHYSPCWIDARPQPFKNNVPFGTEEVIRSRGKSGHYGLWSGYGRGH